MSSRSESHRVKCAVLGATGTVGQRFLALLADHPMLELVALGASPRTVGMSYGTAVTWKLPMQIPDAFSHMTVVPCDPSHPAYAGVRIVFSAGEIEKAFVEAGFCIFSNAKNHRMDPLVPLVVPTANPTHLRMIEHQRKIWNTKGFLVANANCSSTGLVVPLKALMNTFGPLSDVHVTTLQAISGAGYPGVPSLDILDNVVPHILGEEDKLESEPHKILSPFNPETDTNITHISKEDMRVSASCHRVPVLDGHTVSISVKFARQPPPSVEQIIETLKSFSLPELKDLPFAPTEPIVYLPQNDRPQPRLDRDTHKGMAVVVGRVRTCSVLDIKMTILVHNTILGAAGSGILNAEAAIQLKLI